MHALNRQPQTHVDRVSPVRIRYMGNKHEIADDIARLAADLRPGAPLLDLFCGMCSVAGAVAPSGRPVWGNDAQWTASAVAHCLLASADDPVEPDALVALLKAHYEENFFALSQRFHAELKEESLLLEDPDEAEFGRVQASWPHTGNDAHRASEAAELALAPSAFPYRLVTLSFAWGYFGLRQAIQLDSLKYAIDRVRAAGQLTEDESRWALVALLQAASCAASTPGHFAQFLGGQTRRGLARVVAQRRRDIWHQFGEEAGSMAPFGNRSWRAKNRVFRQDALSIWAPLRSAGFRNAVVYADPPYSKDHYSRFYHVLDTILRYDYPVASGKGRYRPDRFVTPFSIKTKVVSSFDQLARGVAATGSALLLSYPSNGLLGTCDDASLDAILARHFGDVTLVMRKPTDHSTLGGRHGSATNRVQELLYLARPRTN